jgi:hypothetical protein
LMNVYPVQKIDNLTLRVNVIIFDKTR